MCIRNRLLASMLVTGLSAGLPASPAGAEGPVAVARDAEPVVVLGAQIPTWSRLAAEGVAAPYPSGALDETRDAHNGTLTVPPDARTGVPVGEIAAYRYETGRWREIPVQVDERYPYFLANGRSDFGMYSGTDYELTYAWDDENWMKTAGECSAEYPAGKAAVPDPAAGLDDDDEIVFMASDAGDRVPDGAPGPPGTGTARQQVAVADPLDPSEVGFVYLFRRPGGSSFDASTGYVRYQRDANADRYIDRGSFAGNDPEKLGSSNTGYGPNLGGTVCDPDGTVRTSTDRFPRDGVTVTTDRYRWRATGRWMVREMHVAKPGQPGVYGPDLIDRWKGRAFQQSPDSTISVVGFEDEQVNWEANSALLGERTGPVRAIRETWGADSGTNVTKTETFYRDAVAYRYHLRVHPIPPDGIYTSWDYNKGVAVKYFNALKPEGVNIDGINDDTGNVDDLGGQPAYFDAPDPTFNLPSAYYTWEQISGKDDAGSLVYTFEVKGPTSALNPLAVPYYRDDKCLDDGTGDDPVPRPWPGEASTDQRVRDGYAAQAGKPYADVTCDEKQGAWASHGVHIFVTHDTDNAAAPVPTTEVDAQQWQWAVPTAQPGPVGEPYVETIRAPLRTALTEQANVPGPAGPPEDTSITSVQAEQQGDTLRVTGSAVFGGMGPVTVGTDPAGDTAHPYPAALGYDLVSAAIGQPDAGTGDLEFVLDLADLPPTGGLPEAARYFWDFGVKRGEETTLFAIEGKLTDVVRRQRTDSQVFVLQANCATDANNIITCEDVASLSASMDGKANRIRVIVPRAALEQHAKGSLAGATIEPAEIFEGISTAPSAYFSQGGTGDVLAQDQSYPVAVRAVSVAVVPAGQTPGSLTAAGLGPDGAFAQDLDVSGLAPGAYEVWVRACFGADCATAVHPFTL
jgi:hypothetical protein